MTAALPRPLAADAVVRIDAAARDLVVAPSADARGLVKLLWRDGVAAVAGSSDRRGGPPTVWADATVDGRRVGQVAHGVPGAGNTLRFHFHPGHPEYSKLVATPGLRATIVVDRGAGHVLGVTFHARRTN